MISLVQMTQIVIVFDWKYEILLKKSSFFPSPIHAPAKGLLTLILMDPYKSESNISKRNIQFNAKSLFYRSFTENSYSFRILEWISRNWNDDIAHILRN